MLELCFCKIDIPGFKIRLCHTAAILSRETKKALFYHAEPCSQNRGGEAKRGKTKLFWSPGTIWPPCDNGEYSNMMNKTLYRPSRVRLTQHMRIYCLITWVWFRHLVFVRMLVPNSLCLIPRPQNMQNGQKWPILLGLCPNHIFCS